MAESIGYPRLNGVDFWAAIYCGAGVEPPWLQNWKDGKVVPLGEGGTLDVADARKRPSHRRR
jgi:hypothetical protein